MLELVYIRYVVLSLEFTLGWDTVFAKSYFILKLVSEYCGCFDVLRFQKLCNLLQLCRVTDTLIFWSLQLLQLFWRVALLLYQSQLLQFSYSRLFFSFLLFWMYYFRPSLFVSFTMYFDLFWAHKWHFWLLDTDIVSDWVEFQACILCRQFIPWCLRSSGQFAYFCALDSWSLLYRQLLAMDKSIRSSFKFQAVSLISPAFAHSLVISTFLKIGLWCHPLCFVLYPDISKWLINTIIHRTDVLSFEQYRQIFLCMFSMFLCWTSHKLVGYLTKILILLFNLLLL